MSAAAPAFIAPDAPPATAPVEQPTLPDLPPEPTKPDEKPTARPTTRAGRAAAAQAKKLQKTAKKETAPKPAKATPRRASLETRLTGSLVTLGTTVAVAGGMVSPAFHADGILIVEHAGNVAAALDKVAKDQPHVAAALEKMLTAGVYSGLIAAMLPLAIGIAANHGAIPAGMAEMLGAAQPAPEPEDGGIV